MLYLLSPKPKYKTNFTNCIQEALNARHYTHTDNDDWDLVWREKEFIPDIYAAKLTPTQKVNHFKNWQELCRKDQLIRNLKKHKKQLERDGKTSEANTYNFYPQTYILPHEYVIFVDEFKRMQQENNKNIWIMKPTGKAQGKGIFLLNRLAQAAQWDNHHA